MNNSFWGPSIWNMIHSSAFMYHSSNKYSYREFILSLKELLPCEACQVHLLSNLKILPLREQELYNNKQLFIWSYLLHDIVNKQLGKKSPTFETVHHFYSEHIHKPSFWGPHYWRGIHSIAASYNSDKRHAFKRLIYALPGLLPSNESRQALLNCLKILPLTDEYLKDKSSTFLWTYLLHDLINKQLGKTSPSFESIKHVYFNNLECTHCSI